MATTYYEPRTSDNFFSKVSWQGFTEGDPQDAANLEI